MIKVTISQKAQQDVRDIGEFIGQDNIDAAISFVQRLMRRFDELAPFPAVGRKRDDLKPGYRSVTEGEYLIFYRLLSEEELEIVRVIHGKRHLGAALNE